MDGPDDPVPIAPIVEVVRGPLVEATHFGAVAVVRASGELIGQVGNPHRLRTYWRSAAKPFQTMPLVYTGAADQFGLTPADVAICCGSHNGEPHHVRRVARLLDKAGVGPGHLVCGAHPPLHPESAEALQRQGAEPTALHHNCSGLHAGMLLLAVHLGADLEGYALPDHPVQREISSTIGHFTDLDPAEIILGVDGCGVPCHGLSLYRMALAYARLMNPAGAVPGRHAAAAEAIRAAMTAHPSEVAGTGRFDTDLIAATHGAVLAKGGASGVQCAGLVSGTGYALKVGDGATGPSSPGRPTAVATLETLRQLDVLDGPAREATAAHARPLLTTEQGEEVGHARPVFDLSLNVS